MTTQTDTTLDSFTAAYIECALWSSNDETDETGGQPLLQNYSVPDIAPASLARIIADCAAFQRDNSRDLCCGVSRNAEEGGHCFWLSRNGHGSGFFDSEHFANDTRERLQEAARKCGSCGLYVGDDGLLYVS